jgi:hypothetical protein
MEEIKEMHKIMKEIIKSILILGRMKLERINHDINWWIAFHLPAKILLFAFVRAYSLLGESPTKDYTKIYNYIVKKYKIKKE